MSTYAKGADPEALARSASSIRGLRGELAHIEASTRGAMSVIKGNWGGGDLHAMVSRFDSTAIPAMQACTAIFDGMASTLDRNSRAQSQASGSGAGGTGDPGGTDGEGGDGDGSDSGGSSGPPLHGKNDVTKTGGKKFDSATKDAPDSIDDGNGNSYQHTVRDGRHSYDVSKAGENGWDRYDKYTHDGDNKDRLLEHEVGRRAEFERGSQSSEQPKDYNERHPVAGRAIDGVNWVERTPFEKPEAVPTHYYDANGQPTDADHAVTSRQGGVLYAETSGYSEKGIKDGALYSGAAVTAGAYLLKGKAEGNLGDHQRYEAGGFVGAEAKAERGISLGKDGLEGKASAEAFVGAKGNAGISYENGPLAAHSEVKAMAGAEAKADASLAIGKDGVKAHAGGEVFAGVKASAETGGSLAGVGGTVGGEVYAGVGAHAKVDANISLTSIKANVDVGASLGIGGGVKLSVDIQPKVMIHDAGEAAKAVEGTARHVAGSINKLFGG